MIPATELAPRQLEALYFNDAAVVIPPSGVDVPRAQRDGLAGTYQSANGALTVVSTDAGLEVRADDPSLFGSLGTLAPPAGGSPARSRRKLRWSPPRRPGTSSQ